MSLVRKPKISEKKMEANRGNGPQSQGAVTPQGQGERDEILAGSQEKATLMVRAGESSLRQVLRITRLSMNTKDAARLRKRMQK